MTNEPHEGILLGNRYRMGRRLGSGAMGRVHHGIDTVDGRDVAIKLLDATGWTDEVHRRFAREGRILCSLDHPNILRCFAVGTDGDVPYMVTEFLAGRPLDEIIDDDGPVPLTTFFPWAGALVEALAHAHGHGILHRDIKAANVMILDDGSLRLLDFGLARQVGGGTKITETGVVVGTPDYLSPEMIAGETLTKASDVYSVGVLLFEMLAGRLPFPAPTLADVLAAHTRLRPPSLRQLRPELSRGLVLVVERCLEKEPAARYQAFTELGAALQRVAAADPRRESATELVSSVALEPITRPMPVVRRRRVPLVVLTVGLLVGAVLLRWSLMGPPPQPDERTVGPATARLVWHRLTSPLDFEVRQGSRVVLRGAVEQRGTVGLVEVRGLNPGAEYAVTIRGTGGETVVPFTTKAVESRSKPYAALLHGAFFLAYDTNAPAGCRLAVRTSDGSVHLERRDLPGAGQVVVDDLPHATAAVDWTLSLRDSVIASGTTTAGVVRCTALGWRTEAIGRPHGRSPGMDPFWVGDELVVSTLDGLLHVLALHGDSQPHLGTKWVFRPAGHQNLRGDNMHVAGVASLSDGRLFVLAYYGKACTEAFCLDRSLRAERWNERVGGTVHTLPPWVLAEGDVWNSTLGPTEWRRTHVDLDLLPRGAALPVGEMLVVPVSSVSGGGFWWLDRRDGRLVGCSRVTLPDILAAPRLAAKGRPHLLDHPYTWAPASAVLHHDGRVLALFDVGKPDPDGKVDWCLVTCAVPTGADVPTPKVEFTFVTASRWQDPVLVRDVLWMTYGNGVLRWVVGGGSLPTVLGLPSDLPPGDVLSPLTVHGDELLFFRATSPIDHSISYGLLRQVSLVTARVESGRLTDVRVHAPFVLEEPTDDSGHVLRLVRTPTHVTGTGRSNLFAFDGDLRGFGTFAPDPIRHVEGWALRADGLIATMDGRAVVTVVPVGLVAHVHRRTLTPR